MSGKTFDNVVAGSIRATKSNQDDSIRRVRLQITGRESVVLRLLTYRIHVWLPLDNPFGPKVLPMS